MDIDFNAPATNAATIRKESDMKKRIYQVLGLAVAIPVMALLIVGQASCVVRGPYQFQHDGRWDKHRGHYQERNQYQDRNEYGNDRDQDHRRKKD